MRKRLAVVAALVGSLLTASLAAVAAVDPGGDNPAGRVVDHIVEQTAGGPIGRQLAPVAATTTQSGSGQSGTAPTLTPSFTFYANQELPCDPAKDGALTSCAQGVEPEVKSAPDGTIFVTAQDGTPGGVLAWRRDPGAFSYKQLDKPDGVAPVSGAVGLTGGGGDNELAISAPDKDGHYRVYVSSLMSLVTNAVAVSTDRGDTWFNNPVASSFVGVDRQWLAASGEKTVYLAYHDLAVASILMTRSDDGGVTWGPPMEMMDSQNAQYVAAQGPNWESNLVAFPNGGVATAFVRDNETTNKMTETWVAVTDSSGTAVKNVKVGDVPIGDTAAGLFPAIAVDRAGNLYVTVSNRHGVFLASSRDRGTTWSPFTEVTAGNRAANASTVFPYVVAGSSGRVALAWLGSTSTVGETDSNADWNTNFAYSTNALDATPTFTLARASDHTVHHGVICLDGTDCNALDNSRALAEVLQMGVTTDGRALISYPDTSDGQHAGGWTWLAEQQQGPGLYADVTPKPSAAPVVGHTTSAFYKTGSQTLWFTNPTSGSAAPAPVGKVGYTFDGPNIAGSLAPSTGTVGHEGVIGYVANDTPGGGRPVVFTGAPLSATTTIGGALHVTLYVQNELADNAATELDFSLADVGPDGTVAAILGRGVQAGDPVVGGADPVRLDFSYAIAGGYLLPAGHRLQMSMSFPYVDSSTTRLYYGDATYASAIGFDVGSDVSPTTSPKKHPPKH